MFGSWQHKPNALAAQWLAHAVWPIVRREVTRESVSCFSVSESRRVPFSASGAFRITAGSKT